MEFKLFTEMRCKCPQAGYLLLYDKHAGRKKGRPGRREVQE